MKSSIQLSIVFVVIILAISCAKERDFEAIFSSSVTELPNNKFIVDATIASGQKLEARGIVYATDSSVWVDSYHNVNTYPNNYNTDGKIVGKGDAESMSFTLNNLKPVTTYYYRLFAVYDGLLKYGDLVSFLSSCDGLGCGPAGGQIIYLDSTGQHGIEVAANYLTPNKYWGCAGFAIGGTQNDVGSGQANTDLILSNCGENTLAWYCDNYEQNGFTDYYMPSNYEMELIYTKVFKEQNNPFDWIASVYYTSTESGISACKAWNFDTGAVSSFSKNTSSYKTVPVRSF